MELTKQSIGSWKSHKITAERAARKARVGGILDTMQMMFIALLVLGGIYVAGLAEGMELGASVEIGAQGITAK